MKKILIVEDDIDIAGALVHRLKLANYEVHVALDAIQAIQAMNDITPDLVLLDISIPAGSGFTVAEKINKLPKLIGTPFIFITAHKDPAFHERAEQLGAQGYFEKPYDPIKLLETIKKVIGDE